MPTRRALTVLVPLAWIVVIAAGLWIAFRHGFANYDTITSFTTFASDTRRFIRAGAGFPAVAAQ